ncbi:MAG: M67 family metallopeptidase [Erythrobacter sp.]|nr:M67 family metallopeptidase [Erythrobacter sp.]
MDLTVTSEALGAMIAHADREEPGECCGILYGTSRQIARAQATANVHPDPARHFEIDPQALLDAHRSARGGGAEVAGYYHSHPNGRAAPSGTDQASASGDGRIWAIVASGKVTFWRDDLEGFRALSYTVRPG